MKYFDPPMFVETFDFNYAFEDVIVQPLISCQLFVSLSSITLKNIIFCLMKNPVFHQYKKVFLYKHFTFKPMLRKHGSHWFLRCAVRASINLTNRFLSIVADDITKLPT